MFGLFRQGGKGAGPWPWRRAPEAGLNAVIDRFLAWTAQIADDAAVAVDADLRRLIAELAPDEAPRYESVVRVPGAFPPYLVWASLTALAAEPLGRLLESGIASRVESRLLESAALVRGKSNARLLSAILYRVERAGADGHGPIDALVPRFWDEVQRMGALSQEGSDILARSSLAHATLARRFAAALRRLDERDGGYWLDARPALERAAAQAGWR